MRLSTWQKVLIPVGMSIIVFIMLWATYPFIVAISFLAGAMVCWLGQGIFAGLMIVKIRKKRPQRFLLIYYIGELLKLAVYAALFVVVALAFKLHLYPMLIGFMINIVIFLLLFINALGDI